MTPYKILTYPDSRLFKVADVVMPSEFGTAHIKNIIERMSLTLRINKGIGLAATQVDIHKRIVVIHLDDCHLVLINPVIESRSLKKTGMVEGCLSLPDVNGKVNRSECIKLKYQNIKGDLIFLEASGLLAKCIQHEIDHLNGILYINRLTELRKYFVLKNYKGNRQ